MKAIFNREYNMYFQGPIGYIYLVFTLLLGGWFFVSTTFVSGSADMTGFFANITITYLFLIPIISMGMLAEERRNKTDQILLTSPVTVGNIVLGKYFAGLGLIGTGMILMLFYPLILNIYGEVYWANTISQFVGLFLMGGALLSVGIFVSSLTENQISSAILSFGIMMFIWLADWIKSAIGSPIIVKIVEWFSVLTRFQDFTTGVLNPASIMYFITFSAVFIFLTMQNLEKRRYN